MSTPANEALRVRVVTLIEAIAFVGGVGIWFVLDHHGHPALGAALGTAWWTVWTDLEHFVAVNLGFGYPLFRGYPFHLQRPLP